MNNKFATIEVNTLPINPNLSGFFYNMDSYWNVMNPYIEKHIPIEIEGTDTYYDIPRPITVILNSIDHDRCKALITINADDKFIFDPKYEISFNFLFKKDPKENEFIITGLDNISLSKYGVELGTKYGDYHSLEENMMDKDTFNKAFYSVFNDYELDQLTYFCQYNNSILR